ncbi:peptidase M76 family-domain-containing protein [Vararia minispora EC-137]|uniref:Peptidase M76 family-domain-containing protein n=1 Tax=Vararia minispora EC-137 TaxID=1314806 RepID=A0ACB8QI02_9AGAM|nr:peptidase M76 family-domain-containing protein [Vararia minispora EC-137]
MASSEPEPSSSTSTPPGAQEGSTQPNNGNKFFQRWQERFSMLTGYGIDPEERRHHINRRNCEKWKKELFYYSPSVTFMVKHLKQEGVDVRPEHFPCVPCDLQRSGGFDFGSGNVILCQGNYVNKKHLEHTMTHELVHLYDHVKFNVDWFNLRHHACSEIRANSLGGDCRWLQEVLRGQFSFSKQHQACVRRRAILSVNSNPACPNRAAAERAVNEVWESCFSDTRPFDEASLLSWNLNASWLMIWIPPIRSIRAFSPFVRILNRIQMIPLGFPGSTLAVHPSY